MPCAPASDLAMLRTGQLQPLNHSVRDVGDSLRSSAKVLHALQARKRIGARNGRAAEAVAEVMSRFVAQPAPTSTSRDVRFLVAQGDAGRLCSTPQVPHDLLILAVADWGADLAARRRSRAPWRNQLLRMLQTHVPLPQPARRARGAAPARADRRPVVLVPAAGTLRLAFEAARLGYDVIANECDVAKLALGDILLNDGQLLCALRGAEAAPWGGQAEGGGCANPRCPGTLQVLSGRVERIVDDAGAIEPGSVDAVLTSFALDRGPSLSTWMRLMDRSLRRGGVWIDAGPFQVRSTFEDDASFGGAVGHDRSRAFVRRLERTLGYEVLAFSGPLLNQFYADGVGSDTGEGERGFNITFAAARKRKSE